MLLISEEALTGMNKVMKVKPSLKLHVVTAAGQDHPILDHVNGRGEVEYGRPCA